MLKKLQSVCHYGIRRFAQAQDDDKDMSGGTGKGNAPARCTITYGIT